VGPRNGLDDVEGRKCLTLPGLELRPLRRPVRSEVAIISLIFAEGIKCVSCEVQTGFVYII
jgi:hypothetical protein